MRQEEQEEREERLSNLNGKKCVQVNILFTGFCMLWLRFTRDFRGRRRLATVVALECEGGRSEVVDGGGQTFSSSSSGVTRQGTRVPL